MRWQLRQGDLLEVTADVLVCSANVFLTLSGGVGGAFLVRYGPEMQAELETHLRRRGIRHLERGDVIATPPCNSPYKAVLHAIAVDGMYETSPEIVAAVILKALHEAAALSANSVALAALATGYGRMSMPQFAQALTAIIEVEIPPLERIVIGLRSPSDVEELASLVSRLEVI